jgi:hypothetical protein
VATSELTGRAIRYQPKFSVLGALLLAIAAVLLSGGIATGNPHWMLLSLLPAALGFGLFYFRPQAFEATLGPNAIEVIDPPQQIPYTDIESLSLDGRQFDLDSPTIKPGPILIVHRRGVLEIPPPQNVSAEAVYRHLVERVGQYASREVNYELQEHLQQQLADFGPDRVWTFSARSELGQRSTRRRGRWCCALLCATGVAWIIAASVLDLGHPRGPHPGWLGGGVTLAIVAGLIWLALHASQRAAVAKVPNWQAASIVVSPKGIAMIQGKMRGHLRWDELREIRLGARRGGFQWTSNSAHSGVQLVIEGATITIVDIYDQPLAHISGVMRRLWRPAPEFPS